MQTFLMDREFLEDFLEKPWKNLGKTRPFKKSAIFLNLQQYCHTMYRATFLRRVYKKNLIQRSWC